MHGLMMDTPLLVTEIMRYADKNHPRGEVVSVTADAPRHRCTYADVFRRARQLANALADAGVREGDCVGTLAWNDYRHLELYYAVSCMGAVLHTVNPRLFPEQVEYIINHAEDRLLFIDPTLLPLLAQLDGKLPTVRKTIVMTSDAALPAAVTGKLESYEAFIAGQPDDIRLAGARRARRLLALLHLGHDGQPEGRAVQPPLDRAARLRRLPARRSRPVESRNSPRRRADVPRQRLGAAVQRPHRRREARVPGAEDGRPRDTRGADRGRRRHARRGRAHGVDRPAQLPGPDRQARADVEAHSRRWLGSAAEDDPRFRPEARHRRAAGLGHDRDESDRLGQFICPRRR